MAVLCLSLLSGTPLPLLAFAFLSSNPTSWVRQSSDPSWYIAAPGLLLLYYLILFLLVHRRRQHLPLIPQYAPPQNLSPAALRYLFIGDSDSKSVAAVLLQLASRGLISIKGHKNWFIINKLTDRVPPDLPPEELTVFSVMFLRPEPINTLRIPDELLAPDLPNDAYPILLSPATTSILSPSTSNAPFTKPTNPPISRGISPSPSPPRSSPSPLSSTPHFCLSSPSGSLPFSSPPFSRPTSRLSSAISSTGVTAIPATGPASSQF